MLEIVSDRFKRARHPGGREILFDPEPHAYLLDGEPLISVTTLIKSWFPEFDAPAVAARKAARDGVLVADLLAQWARRREEAGRFGTKVHQMAETMILARDYTAANHLAVTEREKNYLACLSAALLRIGKFYDFVDCEKIVFSPERRVAGTIDVLLRNKQTGAYVIADWKTNREIKLSSFNDEMGHGHCVDLHNCNFIHYSLQLNAYRELLLSEGYLPADADVSSILVHLRTEPSGVRCDFVRPRALHHEAGLIVRQPR